MDEKNNHSYVKRQSNIMFSARWLICRFITLFSPFKFLQLGLHSTDLMGIYADQWPIGHTCILGIRQELAWRGGLIQHNTIQNRTSTSLSYMYML